MMRSLLKVSVVLVIFVTLDWSYLPLPKSRTGLADAEELKGNDWKDLLLTKGEKEALDSFKKKILEKLPEPWMKTDFYLIKWLRARQLDIQAAEAMLLDNIKWREENRISEILSEDFSEISRNYPLTMDTHDKRGRPVGTINLGIWDIKAADMQGNLDRVSRYMDLFQESLFQQIITAQGNGQEVTRAVALIDLKGFNVIKSLCASCISIYTKILSGSEDHYPGFWEELVLINSPPMFQMVIQTVGGGMSSETRQTMRIFSSNKNEWTKYLDNKIDSNERYANFGGSKQ